MPVERIQCLRPISYGKYKAAADDCQCRGDENGFMGQILLADDKKPETPLPVDR
jgi:hypothetical protein